MSNDPLTDPAVRLRYSPVALGSIALLSLGAGLINLALVPAQLPASALFGVLFLGVGLIQIVLAGSVVRTPGQRLFVTAAVGTTVLVLLWLISGTTGLPFGTPAPIGVPDTVCAALELVSVPILLTLALRGPRRRRRRPARTALLTAPIVLVVAAATFVGLGTEMSTMSAMPAASPSGDPGGIPVTALVAAPGAQPVKSFTLTAQTRMFGDHLSYTYNGTVPGPELRVTQGDRVRVRLVNRLPVATTVHWHGVRVPNAADGVAGVTQDAVAPGGSFTYEPAKK
jgi:FtsP/CotA-like multicopper oxidase with cupredoxin domain